MTLIQLYHMAVMIVCLSVLAGISAWFFARLLGGAFKRLAGFLGGAWISLAFVAGIVFYGGGKGVRWDAGLTDNGTLITNDLVEVRWSYSGIPSASTLYIDCRQCGSDGEWTNLAELPVSALVWTGTLANATNYDYWIYTTYVPPVPVHTNGVWVGQAYETKARVGARAFIILNGKVIEHGRTIAPPVWKRKEEEENDN